MFFPYSSDFVCMSCFCLFVFEKFMLLLFIKTLIARDFSDPIDLRFCVSNAGQVSIPYWGTKMPHATHVAKKIK